VSPLALAVLNYLQAEAGWPPLRPDSISRGLWQTGAGLTAEPIPAAAIEGALAELMAAGQVERVHSARLGPRYRVIAQCAEAEANA
jgi:hypothetical protein